MRVEMICQVASPEDFSFPLLFQSVLPPLHVSQLVEALETIYMDFRGLGLRFKDLIERFGCQGRFEVALGHFFLDLLDLVVVSFDFLVRRRWLGHVSVVLVH